MERNTGFEPATFALATRQSAIHDSPRPLPESARTCDFLRVLRLPLRAQLHESSRGFSTFMCPECATIAPQHHAPLTRRHAGGSPTRMFDRARLPAVRAGQVAPLPQHPERDQVRLQGSRLRSSERDLQGSFLKTMPRPLYLHRPPTTLRASTMSGTSEPPVMRESARATSSLARFFFAPEVMA